MSKENELKSRFEAENDSVTVFKYFLTSLMSREIRPIDFYMIFVKTITLLSPIHYGISYS